MGVATITNPVTKIGDAIRGSLIADRPEQIGPLLHSVIERVTAQGGKFYIKNFWADPKPLSLGYVGVHIKIRMPIPSEKTSEAKNYNQSIHQNKKYILMELQLHLRAIMDGTGDCAKEIAHRLYKVPREATEEKISPEIISSSQLVYLTAMTKLLASKEDLQRTNHTVSLMQKMTKEKAKKRLVMETAQLLHNEKLGRGEWNDQLQVVVPKHRDAVSQAWMDTAKKINKLLNLSAIKMDDTDALTNTATSVDELHADAMQIAPFFRSMCKEVAASRECTPSFGPDNNHIIKEKGSLQAKVKADREEELGRFVAQLLIKIGRSLSQITEDDSVRLETLSTVQNLNLTGCSQISDSDLSFLGLLSALQSLSLAECHQITDKGLVHLTGLTELRSLNLAYCHQITDKGLVHLWRLIELKSLVLLGCDGITDNALARGGLQHLNLASCRQPVHPIPSRQRKPPIGPKASKSIANKRREPPSPQDGIPVPEESALSSQTPSDSSTTSEAGILQSSAPTSLLSRIASVSFPILLYGGCFLFAGYCLIDRIRIKGSVASASLAQETRPPVAPQSQAFSPATQPPDVPCLPSKVQDRLEAVCFKDLQPSIQDQKKGLPVAQGPAFSPQTQPSDTPRLPSKVQDHLEAVCLKDLQPSSTQDQEKGPPVAQEPAFSPQTQALINQEWIAPEEQLKRLCLSSQDRELLASATNWHTALARLAQTCPEILPRVIPPLPADIIQILESECPIYADQAQLDGTPYQIKDTHVLVLIPQEFGTLNQLEEGVLKPYGTAHYSKAQNPIQFRCFWDNARKEHGDVPFEQTHWVLMSKDILPGSRSKKWDQQVALVDALSKKAKINYKAPSLQEAVACTFLHKIATGESILQEGNAQNENLSTYTRVQAMTAGCRLVVGGFAPSGVHVFNGSFDYEDVGVAAIRRL